MLYFPSDHPIFEGGHYSTIDGTKHDSIRRGADSCEEQERERARLAALRDRLARVIGCENTLALLLRMATGEVRCSNIADALGVHRSTILRRVRRYHAAIRRRWLADEDAYRSGVLEGSVIDLKTRRQVP